MRRPLQPAGCLGQLQGPVACLVGMHMHKHGSECAPEELCTLPRSKVPTTAHGNPLHTALNVTTLAKR